MLPHPSDHTPHGSVVLLDTEGIDLGDKDTVRNLGVLSWLLSSETIVFTKETVTTHMKSFLYEVVRFVETLFPGHGAQNYGRLHMLLRDPKNPPPGESVEGYVRKSLTEGGEMEQLLLR